MAMRPPARRRVIDDPQQLLAIGRRAADRYLAAHPGVCDADDILSDAMLGVAQAALRWRPDGGAALRTYASRRAEFAIIDGLRERTGQLSRSEYAAHARTLDGSGATVVADLLPPYRRRPLSLDAWLDEPRAKNPAAGPRDIPDPAAAAQLRAVTAREVVDQLLGFLGDRERDVVVAHDLLGYSLTEVAAALGVTPGRASQIRGQALARMRDAARDVEPTEMAA